MRTKKDSPRSNAKSKERAAASNSLVKVPGQQPASMGERQRRETIALAAYYLAEQRGFEPGHELEDWIKAEAQIDTTAATVHVEFE